MRFDLLKANLNLYAVLQNLEDLVTGDSRMADLARPWHISIQFVVRGGPAAYVDFQNGACTHGRGKHPSPAVRLYFTSPAHLNAMFDGTARPIPLWGFTKLGFLAKDFAQLTGRLAYYLKPTDELLKDPAYLALNTRLTLHTAVFALPELAALDPIARHAAAQLRDGTIVMKVMPNGPTAHVTIHRGRLTAGKGDAARPHACMFMKDMATANAFLNHKIDPFTAIASGRVAITGHIPLLDAMSLILDRVPVYLS